MWIIILLCVFVLISVIVLQFVLLLTAREQLSKQQVTINENKQSIKRLNDDMDVILKKVAQGIKVKLDMSSTSILDLAEFKDLDPTLKQQYKKYILDILFPAIMEGINKSASDMDLVHKINLHDQEITDMLYNIATDLKKNGIINMIKYQN